MKIPDPRHDTIVQEKVLTAHELERLKETFEVRVLNASLIKTREEMLRQIGELWDFPPHYGQNWDAMIDCLSDLSWIGGNRFAFVIRGLSIGNEWETLLECLEDVSNRWQERDPESGFVSVLVAT